MNRIGQRDERGPQPGDQGRETIGGQRGDPVEDRADGVETGEQFAPGRDRGLQQLQRLARHQGCQSLAQRAGREGGHGGGDLVSGGPHGRQDGGRVEREHLGPQRGQRGPGGGGGGRREVGGGAALPAEPVGHEREREHVERAYCGAEELGHELGARQPAIGRAGRGPEVVEQQERQVDDVGQVHQAGDLV